MKNELSFAQSRLNQLTEQLLSETTVTGDIIFFADEDAAGISGATWRFEDEDHRLLQECGFKFMLMELVDILIKDRASEGHGDALHGIIRLQASSPVIDWFTAEQAEKQRSADY